MSSAINPQDIKVLIPTAEKKTKTKGPKFTRYFGPVVMALKENNGSASPSVVFSFIQKLLNLTEEEINATTKNNSSRFGNQVSWARFYLAKAGYIDNSEHGIWKLTELGNSTSVEEFDEVKSLTIFQGVHSLFSKKTDDFENTPPKPDEDESGDSTFFFTQRTFELLKGINETPKMSFYKEREDEFKVEIEQPFQGLMLAVASLLPNQIRDRMETEKQIFSKFNKNDFGQGGAWEHYWGAFYPKGSKRTLDAQLAVWINYKCLQISFYIGDYGDEVRERFRRNCRNYSSLLPKILVSLISKPNILLASDEKFKIEQKGDITATNLLRWENWFKNPEASDYGARIEISKQTLLTISTQKLVDLVLHSFIDFFPLVLLAGEENPIPAIQKYLDLDDEEGDDRILQDEYSIEKCSQDTGFEIEILKGWVRAIERKGQAILFGPPGTGKTYMARALAKHLVGGTDGFVDLVQFHPAYSYEDFIQGIRPKRVENGLDYPTLPGRFLDFCNKAKECSGKCILIIDEINRANLARVFGELMYLLEYRGSQIPLAGGGNFNIPGNVRLIGTMNTADRSIALVDHALRRRFAFLPLYPNYNVLRKFHQLHQTGFPIEELIVILQNLNENYIRNPHYEVGISFFLRNNLTAEINDIWQMEIHPYLEEFFFDQPAYVRDFQWEKIKDRLGQ